MKPEWVEKALLAMSEVDASSRGGEEARRCLAAALPAFLSAAEADGFKLVGRELDRRLGDAGLDAMWPSGEIIFDDAFDSPEAQLSAGWRAMHDAAPGAKAEQP